MKEMRLSQMRRDGPKRGGGRGGRFSAPSPARPVTSAHSDTRAPLIFVARVAGEEGADGMRMRGWCGNCGAHERRAILPAGGAPRRRGERPRPAPRAGRVVCATRPLGRTLPPRGAGAAAAAGRLVRARVGAGRAARRRSGRRARRGVPAAGRGVSAAGRGRCPPWRAARRRLAPASPPLLCSSVPR